jgi:hypothetical protein
VANHRRFIHLQENSVTHNRGAQTNCPERTCQSNQLAKIDWESLLRDTKRDKDLRALGRATIQASRIDYSSGFLERFARQFAALPVAGKPLNSTHPRVKSDPEPH